MTAPTWTVRVAAGEAPTALIVERPDDSLVTEQDRDALYELINGNAPDPEVPDPNMPPGLAPGRCGETEPHDPHVATIQGDDGQPFKFWCTGVPAAPLDEDGAGE